LPRFLKKFLKFSKKPRAVTDESLIEMEDFAENTLLVCKLLASHKVLSSQEPSFIPKEAQKASTMKQNLNTSFI